MTTKEDAAGSFRCAVGSSLILDVLASRRAMAMRASRRERCADAEVQTTAEGEVSRGLSRSSASEVVGSAGDGRFAAAHINRTQLFAGIRVAPS